MKITLILERRSTRRSVSARIEWLFVVLMAVGVLFPRAVEATTLLIESGSIIGSGAAGDTLYNFGGPDFSAKGVTTGFVPQISQAISGLPQGFALSPNPSPIVPNAGLTVFGVGTCPPLAPDLPPLVSECGQIVLTNSPIVVPPNDPAFMPPFTSSFTATVPFTATGFLDVGTVHAFDIVGQGFVTFTFCGSGNCPDAPFTQLTDSVYTFVVPEPATLLLASIGLSVPAFAGCRRWRRKDPTDCVGNPPAMQ